MKNGSLPSRRNRNGFILVSVLLSVSMLLTSASAFAWYAKNEMKRVENSRFILQTRSVAEIGCAMLASKIGADDNEYDSHAEPLYSQTGSVKINIGDYTINANITPLDDKIPIGGIFLPDGVTVRKEYESAWDEIWDYLKQPQLGVLVLDFMDADDKQKLGGSERDNNINRLVSDLTELKQIAEIDDGILWGTKKIPGGLGRYVTIYGKQKINFNTAAPEVIAILDEEIDIQQARNLAAYRRLYPLRKLDDLKKAPGFPRSIVTKLANVVDFKSNFFRLDMHVTDKSGRERNYRIILQRGGSSCRIVRWEE